MQVVGLLGGVASGKSLVARQLSDLGAGLLIGDDAGHEVLAWPEVVAGVRARWGQRVFGPDGRIDRSRVAQLVFAPPPDGPRELEYLERLTHPKIGTLLRQQAAQMAASGRLVAVLDAAVMLKAGWDGFCDRIVFVDTPRATRLARARDRGWSEEEFARREAAQESLDEKRRRADTIIDNSGSAEGTRAQVARLWRTLVG